MNKNYIKDIERKRAGNAYEAVEEGIKKSKKYASHVKRIPMLILNNGLLPALAFMHQKEDEAYKIILSQIINWCSLLEKDMDMKSRSFDVENVENTFSKIINFSQPEYRYWTKEILSLLVWMKRFGEGMEIREKENLNESNLS